MKQIFDSAPRIHLAGQAGVWTVAAQLAIRGLHVHFPGVDYGYDILIDGGIRIQVKSSRLLDRASKKNGPDGYSFKFWRSATRYRAGRPRDYSKVCHFVVLWGIDENRFWIVPAPLIANTAGLLVGPKGFYERSRFTEASELAAAGLSKHDIAERLGITVQGVDYQLRGGRLRRPRQTVGSQVRELEGRWDLITGALATLNEANVVVLGEKRLTQAEQVAISD